MPQQPNHNVTATTLPRCGNKRSRGKAEKHQRLDDNTANCTVKKEKKKGKDKLR